MQSIPIGFTLTSRFQVNRMQTTYFTVRIYDKCEKNEPKHIRCIR